VIDLADTSNIKATFGLDENVASALSYVLGWVTGIIFYLMEKSNRMVKFHAMQAILVFLPLNILYWIFWYGFWSLAVIIGIVMFILWIVLIIKAYQGEMFKLPIAGDIAESHSK
jgi:uncharacterized membrane protein